MYANFSRLLGVISVKETPSHIIVNGIPGLRFSKDVYNHWKTSKINNNMFSSISRSSVKFPKFYGIEMLYMLDKLIESRRTYVGRRVLQRMRDELVTQTWLRNIGQGQFTPRVDLSKLKDLTFTLFPYQLEFLKHYDRATFEYSLRGMLMDAAAGSGKTASQYAISHCVGADTSVLVVPKNSVFDVWVKTVKVIFKDQPSYWHSLSGETPELGKKYYIVHYDYLDKFLAFAKANKGSFGQVYLGIDESHNFNEQSGRTSALIELCQTMNARDVIHASGTPFKAMGSEAITLLTTICNDFTPEVQGSFRKIFGKEAKRAIEILANRIGIVSFKVVKEEVETPGVDYHEVKVTMKNSGDYTLTSVREKMTIFIKERQEFYRKGMPEYEKLYATCMEIHGQTLRNQAAVTAFAEYRRSVALLRKGYDPVTMKDLVMGCNRYELKVIVPSLPDRYRKPFLNVRAIIKYVDLKVMGEALSQVLGRLRIQCHLDMLPNMPLDTIIDNATTKTVIFTSYVEVVKELDDLLTKAGYKPLLVYGETNKDLPAIVKRFEQDTDINPLIATFKSLSTAVPLTMANTVVFTNAPFRAYERTQTIARVDRVGQKHRCHVHETYLDTGAEPNISTRSKDIMAWSAAQVEAILGVKAPDDLDASLEALVENPQATLSDGEQFIRQLQETLPTDVVEEGEVSMEGFIDLFKSVKAPTLTLHDLQGPNRDKLVKLFLNNLSKTYLDKRWLDKQAFSRTTVQGADISAELMMDGKFTADSPAFIETARKRATVFCKNWSNELAKTNDEIQTIDKQVKASLRVKQDDEAMVEEVKAAILKMRDVAYPTQRFPKFDGTALGNKVPVVSGTSVAIAPKMPVKSIETIAAIPRDKIEASAKLLVELLTNANWAPQVTVYPFIDALDGNPLAKWLWELGDKQKLHWAYYDLWSRRHGKPAHWATSVNKRLFDQDRIAMAILKWMARSID